MKQLNNEKMKIQAKEVKIGMSVSFGWGEWLQVKSIEKSFQKNGKELTTFRGDSIQILTKSTSRKYPIIGNETNVDLTFKSETQVKVK
jgi:hypothetical protein